MMLSVVKMLLIWCIVGVVVGIVTVAYAKRNKLTNSELIDGLSEWVILLISACMLPLILMKYVWSAMKGDWQ